MRGKVNGKRLSRHRQNVIDLPPLRSYRLWALRSAVVSSTSAICECESYNDIQPIMRGLKGDSVF